MPWVLQAVNASDQGSPVEAEARPPDHPPGGIHAPTSLPEGLRVRKRIRSSGVTTPKAGGRRRRAQRWGQPISPHPGSNGDHGHTARMPIIVSAPSSAAGPPGRSGRLASCSFQGEDEKDTKRHKQVINQKTQGPQGLQGSGVLRGSLAAATFRKVQASSICLCTGRGWRRWPPTAKPARGGFK